MTDYPRMINAMLAHIEEHLGERLTVETLAATCGYSAFHFGRMFRACLGISVKQYVLARKLETARQRLVRPGRRVIDVAMELGFESPEVFSRAFRRAYGLPPSAGDRLASLRGGVERARMVERDIANWRGSIGLDGEVETLDELRLCGVHATVDVSRRGWDQALHAQAGTFLSCDAVGLGLDAAVFVVIRCLGAPDGRLFDIFHGRRWVDERPRPRLEELRLPPRSYAAFAYRGELASIRETIEDDLYRWMAVRGLVQPPDADFGLLIELGGDYPTSQRSRLRVPLARRD
jgi:AraC family transcriptional regulator